MLPVFNDISAITGVLSQSKPKTVAAGKIAHISETIREIAELEGEDDDGDAIAKLIAKRSDG